jgi:hypothetical protein
MVSWFLKMFKVVMFRGRRLKKLGGDMEGQKQNVASLELTIGEQNVAPLQPKLEEQNFVPSKLGVDESSNQCGLELAMVIFCNSNDDITPNIDWEF